MRIVDCEQGTEEWHAERIKRVTASNFKFVMPAKKKFIVATYTYMNEIAAEIMTGQGAEQARSKSLSWGHEYEDDASNTYAALKNVNVISNGICIDDELRAGASNDGLVEDDGMIEIKCPYVSGKHAATLFAGKMPDEHMPQVQGNLMINGRKWCDFISYDPRVSGKNKIVIIRVERDEEYIKELRSFIIKFNKELDEKLASIGVKYINPTLEESK